MFTWTQAGQNHFGSWTGWALGVLNMSIKRHQWKEQPEFIAKI